METIEVPNETEPVTYQCTVKFYANEYPREGAVIGIEKISIKVVPAFLM